MSRHAVQRNGRAHPQWETSGKREGTGSIFINHAENPEHLNYPIHPGIPAPVLATPYMCYTDQTTPYPIVPFPFNGHSFAVHCHPLALDKLVSGLNYVPHGNPVAFLLYPHQFPTVPVQENGVHFEPNPYQDYGNLQISYPSYPSYPLEANAFEAVNQSECSDYSNSACASICSSNVGPNIGTSRASPKCDWSDHCEPSFYFGIGNRNLFFIENTSSRTSAFVSANARIWGFQNPLVQILRKKKHVVCAFRLPTTVYYAKITAHNIKFSCNIGGVAYLIDEATTKTCWESFLSLEDIASIGLKCLNKCRRNTNIRNVYDSEDINLTNGVVEIVSDSKKLEKIAVTIDKTKVSSKIDNVSNRSYVYLSTFVGKFRASVHFSGIALTLRFHTQTAKLDAFGRLKLGSSSKDKVHST